MDFYIMKCSLNPVERESFDVEQAKKNGFEASVITNPGELSQIAKEKGYVLIHPKTAGLYRPAQQSNDGFTLIFSRDRSDRFIKEALEDNRYIDYSQGKFYGPGHWMKRFVEAAVKIKTRLINNDRLLVEMQNESSFDFTLKVEPVGSLKATAEEIKMVPFGKTHFYLSGSQIEKEAVDLRITLVNSKDQMGKPLQYTAELQGMPYAVGVDKPAICLIPQPSEMTEKAGEFAFTSETQIVQKSAKAKNIIPFLTERIEKVTPFRPAVKKKENRQASVVVFEEANEPALGNEGYRLNVDNNKIVIKANDENGFFYAVQTLFQLMPAHIFSNIADNAKGVNWVVPAVEIRDVPRFGYRGMHLDVGRHMYPVEFIKKYIDLLSMQKMNVFHWHLTEDQGWRIEIKKYPELTKKGAERAQTIANRYQSQGGNLFDDQPYGGYYTQDEIREVVEYARKRCVQVIPEIDLPGHMLAALACYPELGCTGGPYQVGDRWGIYDDVLCAGNENIYPFIEDVLKEVFALFPSEYVHIGGDECPKTRWKKCPKCQEKIKKENLADEKELQSYVIRRVENFLNQNGKKLIGWDEILEGGIAPNASLMSWRGVAGGITAAKSGHPVIMTPNTYVYLDHYQANPDYEPMANGRIASLEWTYSYNPIPAELTASEAKNIIGVQANVWTEYMRTADYVEYMTFPRAAAVAEIAWSEQSKKNWPDFLNRMQTQFDRWRYFGVNYAPHYKK
ncbi:MAG: beta-N-acetylhexosaminidase [Bacteroidales bacterium]